VTDIRRNENTRKTKKRLAKKRKTQDRDISERIFIDRNVDMGKRAMQAGDSFSLRRLNSANNFSQTVKIYFPDTHPFTWPARFERHLNGRANMVHTNAERSGPDPVSFRFEGVGFDDE